MEKDGLQEFRLFHGVLTASEIHQKVSFRARVDEFGAVELEFLPIAGTVHFAKISQRVHRVMQVSYFSLHGVAESGMRFESETLQFSTLGFPELSETGHEFTPKGFCAEAIFRRKLASAISPPVLRIHLRGFECFRGLRADSPLGAITMVGTIRLEDENRLSGMMQIQASHAPEDAEVWRTEAEKFLDHVRRVMSFGASTVLKAPVIEFLSGEILEIQVLSQTKQAPTSLPIIHFLALEPLFDAAVSSYFKPPIEVKNLLFAIEWFGMHSAYSEARLIYAMTALENLIDSNLPAGDAYAMLPSDFEHRRKSLRKALEECIGAWEMPDPATPKKLLADLNEKLPDLNRRSLSKKIAALARQWGVPLEDIDSKLIMGAKNARDQVVHGGHYAAKGSDESEELWGHAMVARELVARFLMQVIGYKGTYVSYMTRNQNAQFPPPPPPDVPA
jgi:hypothetical protein